MSKLTMSVATQTLRLAEPFRIAGHVFDTSDIIVVTLRRGSAVGRGEASGVFFLNEGVAQMQQTLEDARSAIEAGEGREALCAILPPGGARNAVDCALWELEAQEADKPVWALAGLDQPKPLRTTFTLGADSPDAMAHKARAYDHARSIKIKLTGDLDLDIDRVRAIRDARPDAWLGIDGNQGFRKDQLPRLIPALVETGVSLIEQPLARDRDQDLEGLDSPIPVAGDDGGGAQKHGQNRCHRAFFQNFIKPGQMSAGDMAGFVGDDTDNLLGAGGLCYQAGVNEQPLAAGDEGI